MPKPAKIEYWNWYRRIGNLPFVKFCDELAAWSCCVKNPNQMREKGLPDPQLKFMHEINNKHLREIKVRSKTFDKCILDSERRLNNVIVI